MNKILDWLKSLWTKVFKGYDWLRPRAIAAVEVVNIVKNNVENVADAIVKLTPSPKDDVFLAKAKLAVVKAMKHIGEAEGIISGNEKFEDALAAFIELLSSKTEKARLKFWVELAGQVVIILADGKVTISEAIALAQIVYAEFKK